jgi:adenylate cyclase
MSPQRDQDYFCEGIAEELIDALTHVDGLRVVARSSSFQFRQDGIDLREVGRTLGVNWVVEGSVRRAGDQLRVTVQLIDVATGYHKWSQRFERRFGDVFAIQDEIAASVAMTLRGGAALSQREQRGLRRPHTTPEPYEYYLRGRQSLHRMREPDLEQSRRMFEGAIELDADYAPAWAGLATVHALLFEWWGSKDEDLHRAERASQIALELAPDLADAHFARGFALSLHRRYDEAQIHFELAARINPHLFDAYYYYGRAAFARGEIEHSAELFRKAAEVRQEDFQAPTLQSQSLRMLGRIEEARACNREALARAERIVALNPLDGRALAMGALLLFEEGQPERAYEWSQRAVDLYPDDMSALLNNACLKLRSGRHEEALDMIERVFGRGWGKREWVEHDPDYDCVREHPRFKAVFKNLR